MTLLVQQSRLPTPSEAYTNAGLAASSGSAYSRTLLTTSAGRLGAELAEGAEDIFCGGERRSVYFKHDREAKLAYPIARLKKAG